MAVMNSTDSVIENRMTVWERYNTSETLFLETHRPTVVAVTRILPPIWWVIGIIGNTIALIVWLQPKMRHSSGFYLAALAITGLFIVPFNIMFEINFTYRDHILDKPVLCEWYAIFYLSIQYMSPVLVLAFTVERYLSVCHPFRMVNFNQSNSRATLIVILLMLFSCFILNAVQGWFWTTAERDVCDLRAELTQGLSWTIWTWTVEMIVFAAVPLTVLILNILVIKEVRNISRLERRNMRTKSIDRRSTTFMLVGVSFYQIFTVLPVTIIYALNTSYPPGDLYMSDEEIARDPQWQIFIEYFSVRVILNNVGMSHYAANFFIYMLTGKIFRKQLYELVVVYCCKHKFVELINNKTHSTRTTRMSLSSHRGSKSHMGQLALRNLDMCNNDVETINKNSIFISSELEETSVAASGRHPIRTGSMQAQRLVTCVEESDGDISDKENTEQPTTPQSEPATSDPLLAEGSQNTDNIA